MKANILMCGDSGYFQHIAACLISLLDNNKNVQFSVVVLVTKHSPDAEKKLHSSFRNYSNIELKVCEFNAEKQLGTLPPNSFYPPEVYMRFWAEDYFDGEVDRVIYLDGDMVVVDSIRPLLEMDLGENALAAVPIPGAVRPRRLGYDLSFGYFNSGVMVINLSYWRKVEAKTMLIATAFQLEKKLVDPDQDVLNYCFHDRYIQLDYVWNAITPFYKKKNSLTLPSHEVVRVARDAKIVHFNGPSKPWDYLCLHPFAREYLRSVAQTEWRDFKPKNQNLKNMVKKKVISVLGEEHSYMLSRLFNKVVAPR